MTDVAASVTQPLHALKSFQRVHIPSGETKTVHFDISPEMMQMINEKGERLIEAGEFRVYIGGSSPSKVNEALGASKGATASFSVK